MLNIGLNIELLSGASDRPISNEKGHLFQDFIFFHKKNILGLFTGISSHIHFGQIALIHVHGLWQLSLHQSIYYSIKSNIPYVISPRGMLEPWSLNSSKYKKKLALLLYQNKDLKKSACINATSLMEARHIRCLGFKNPIAVIPNGINVSNYKLKKPSHRKEKKILSLSRIHPKKGLENLINAFYNLDPKLKDNCFIEIVGNGEAIISGLVENGKGQTIYGGTDAYDNLYQANGKLNVIRNLNGNVVLVPRYVFEKVGFLDNKFHHDIGDVDYGLRAKKLGISVLTTRINIGKGSENNICRVRKNNVSLINRFKVLYSPLGANPIHHFVFLKRHKGTLPALLYFLFLHFLNFIPDSINQLLFRKKYV